MPSTVEAALILALRERMDALRMRVIALTNAYAVSEAERRAISDELAELGSRLAEVQRG